MIVTKKKLTTTVEKDIIKDIKIQAVKEEISVGDLIEKMFSFYMGNIGKHE